MLDPPDDEGTIGVRPGRRREILYAQSSDADIELARMLITRQPTRPLDQPIVTTADRFGAVPKFYVRCSLDRVIIPEMQDLMLARTACDRVFTIDSDHSPFFSRPNELHQALMEAAAITTSRTSIDGEGNR